MGSGVLAALTPHSKEIVALVTPLIAALVTRSIQPKAKLFHSVRHAFTYVIQEPIKNSEGQIIAPSQVVHVSSISVANSGKSTAKNVEIVFNWKPQYLNVWPLRHFTTLDHEDHRFSILVDSLAPREVFGVSLLSVNKDLPGLCNVRSEQATSVERLMQPQIVYPKWFNSLALLLAFMGLATTIYIALLAVEWAVK